MGYKSVTAAVLAAGFLFANITAVQAKEDNNAARVQTYPVSKGIEGNSDKPKVGKLIMPKKEDEKLSEREMKKKLKREEKLRKEREEKAEEARKEQKKLEKKRLKREAELRREQEKRQRKEAEKREEKRHEADKELKNDKQKVAEGTARSMADKQAMVKDSASKVVEFEDKLYFKGVQLPDDYQQINIYGEAVATKGQAVRLIKEKNPNVHLMCSIEELVDLYWIEAEREGVRPDLALAQSLVETGFYRYGGDVDHNQNNFCGLGTIGGGVKGASFKTPELGVRAHIQHLLAYTQKSRPKTKIIDPRYEIAHSIRVERGVVDTWYGLNGTWAMGGLYCEKIMVMYRNMLAMDAHDVELKKPEPKDDKKEKKSKKKGNIRERIQKILDEGKE